jgi:hypothetical protein
VPNTYTKIAGVTVGSGGSSTISFTSIPSTYTDLLVRISARSATSAGATWNYIEIKPNGSSSNGTWRQLFGSGSSTGSSTLFTGFLAAYGNDSSSTSDTFGNSDTIILNYAGSNYKSMGNDAVTENNGTAAIASFFATQWADTSAITSLSLVFGTGNFAQYSTATLYGIKNS